MNNLSKLTVLTIEDTASFRQLIRLTLEFEGFHVIEASDGEKGLELARSSHPDLILLDLRMPGMDGMQVFLHIMADTLLRRVPVVVLSSSGDSDEINSMLGLGAQGYLIKPFQPKMLIDVVHQRITATSAR